MDLKFYVEWYQPTSSSKANESAGFDTFEEAIAWLNKRGLIGRYMSDEELTAEQTVAFQNWYEKCAAK